MLKFKVFRAFAGLVIVLGVLSAFLGRQMIEKRVVQEAQTRVQHDLDSAQAVLSAELEQLVTILRMAAAKRAVVEAAGNQRWNEDIRNRLALIRSQFGLDFLSVAGADGKVVLRTAPPYNTGDFRLDRPGISEAMAGRRVKGIVVLTRDELEQEAAGLADRAYLVLKPTPRARPTPRTVESRGMVAFAAVPVRDSQGTVKAVLYSGILLNRNYRLVDRIRDVVYGGEAYEGKPMGTATIFLDDVRIATTVLDENGNRAIGTRVSQEVAEQVLDNGRPWIGRAFVVSGWYLTAYKPILDLRGDIVGMLYVGILEKPFRALGYAILKRYLGLSMFGLAAALILAMILSHRLTAPIHRLAEAANLLREGVEPDPVPVSNTCKETQGLVIAFNEMVQALRDREARLRETNRQLEEANQKLQVLNRSYMETVGFVAHELKSPLATMMNYAYLLRNNKLGPLTDKQRKAVETIERNMQLLVEMVRHYLNLSRIENQELAPVPSRVAVVEDVVEPLLEAHQADIEREQMTVENEIDRSVLVYADVNMTREVFENLLSNAIKYGRTGGRIRLWSRDEGDFVRFGVWNEGEGIPPDKIPQLFQKFVRLEGQKAAHRQKGTGLGLFITKHIIEAHGGTIEVESIPHEWVEFRFTLPKYREQSEDSHDHAA